MSSSDETLALATVTILSMAGAAVVLGLVVLTSLSPAPARPVASDPGPACAEWSDGCVVCQRTAQGPACSTPGIACTRGPLQCLRPS